MIGIFGGQQLHFAAVKVGGIDAAIVGIFAGLAACSSQKHPATLLVKIQHIVDIPVSVGHCMFQCTAGGLIKIKIAPVLALGEPENLAAFREIPPVWTPIAAF